VLFAASSPQAIERRSTQVGTPERQGDPSAVLERISEEIASIHEQSYGQRPDSVRTYMVDDVVLCVCDADLLRHEQLIHDSGAGDTVREVRKAFQEAIEATFVSTVEHMTGRRVVAFISDTHLDPSFSIELFRLAPVTDTALEEP
jgi:uncharacterized protein YbcI